VRSTGSATSKLRLAPGHVGAFHPEGRESGRVPVAELSCRRLSFLRASIKVSGDLSERLAIPQFVRLPARFLQGVQSGREGDDGIGARPGPGECVPDLFGQWATSEGAALFRFFVGELGNVTLEGATELEPSENERVGGMPRRTRSEEQRMFGCPPDCLGVAVHANQELRG